MASTVLSVPDRQSDVFVWVLDDDVVLLEFLVEVIAQGGYAVRGLSDPLAFLREFDRGLPDRPQLLLSDLEMPGIDGLELVRLLHARGFHHPVVLMSAFLDVSRTIAAMREGFFDVVTKPLEVPQLLGEIHKAAEAARRAHHENHDAAKLEGWVAELSARELDVLHGLSQGLMNKQVADLLSVSVKTVETHRQHIMHKLGLRTAAELVRLAIEWRILCKPQRAG